jgi:hypothetical protein
MWKWCITWVHENLCVVSIAMVILTKLLQVVVHGMRMITTLSSCLCVVTNGNQESLSSGFNILFWWNMSHHNNSMITFVNVMLSWQVISCLVHLHHWSLSSMFVLGNNLWHVNTCMHCGFASVTVFRRTTSSLRTVHDDWKQCIMRWWCRNHLECWIAII